MASELEKCSTERQSYLPLKKIEHSTDKRARIETIQPLVKNGTIRFCHRHHRLLEQMKYYPKIEQLTRNRKADLLLNIQFGMDIKRNFARYKKQGDSSPLGLFLGGSVDWSTIKEHLDVIKLYKQRIKALGYSTVEYKDIEVRNTKNAPGDF